MRDAESGWGWGDLGDLELDALTVTRNRNGNEDGPFSLLIVHSVGLCSCQ